MRSKVIKRNRCKCNLCQDIIESKSHYDWVRCKCGNVFTDGGREYIRRGYEVPNSVTDLTEYEEEEEPNKES